MKKSIYLLWACLFIVVRVHAVNVLTVNDVNIPEGGQATLEIGCEFDTEYTAFELQIVLPEGLSLLTDEDGYPVIERAFDSNHILTGNLLPSNGNYKITCRSMDNISMPTSGPLLRVTLQADASFTIGTNLTATITSCEFTRTSDSNGENLADVDFSVHITEFRTILDETSTTAPEETMNANVRVKRTITAENWSTICLPFAMTETQVKAAFGNDVQLGDFTGYETTEDAYDNIVAISVNFNSVTEIEANHPYIIKVSSSVTEFTVDGVDVTPEAEPSVSFGTTTGKGKNIVYHPMDFIGTYVADFDFYSAATSYPLFLSGNSFYYATGNTKHMKAFRAFFDFDDYLPEAEAAESRIMMTIESLETTGIRSVTSQTNDQFYSLQGYKVDKPAKGIYVSKGKKLVVK